MRIFYWLADRQGCGWYRCILPGTALADLGHEVAMAELMPEWVQAGGADVVVAQRTCEPGPSVIFQRIAAERCALAVLEIDDDLWSLTPENSARAFYDFDRLDRLRRNLEVADLVTTTTEPLAAVLRGMTSAPVAVLPNMIPARLLDVPRPAERERLTIGWAGGPSHARDFGEVARPWRRLLQHPGCRGRVEAHLVGSDWTDRLRSRLGAVRYTPWQTEVDRVYELVAGFDVGAIPLRRNKFNESKSDVKLLELAALGVPAVASATGPYLRAADEGAPVLLAATHQQWTEHLRYLVANPARRGALGEQARAWAAGRTIEGTAHRWADAYRDALEAA